MRPAQIVDKIERIEPFCHHIDHFLNRFPFPALLIVFDPIHQPCQTFSSDLDQLPEIVHPPCRPQLFDPFIAETQQAVPIPVRLRHAQIQVVNDFRKYFHITVSVKHLAADIDKDLLAPRSHPLRTAAPLILQYHIQLLHGEAEFFDRHVINIGDCQLHCLLIEPCDHRRILMAFLHDLRPHHQTELSFQIVIAVLFLVDRQFPLCCDKIRFLDRIYDALSRFPHEIVLMKQKILISVAAHTQSCQDAVTKLFACKPLTSLDLTHHAK